jgi:Family of unknown function (DUF6880)
MTGTLSANDYGVFDGLVAAMLPALGDTDRAHLRSRLAQALADRRRKAGARDLRTSALRSALQDIADAQADIDAYIALVPVEDRSRRHMGSEIGRRLLAAGRIISRCFQPPDDVVGLLHRLATVARWLCRYPSAPKKGIEGLRSSG